MSNLLYMTLTSDEAERRRARDMAATARAGAFYNRCGGVDNALLDTLCSVIYKFWMAA